MRWQQYLVTEIRTLTDNVRPPDDLVQQKLADRRRHWEGDGKRGESASRFADVRAVSSRSILVQQIAEAHQGCRLRDCGTCAAIRRAVAEVLANNLHEIEVRQP